MANTLTGLYQTIYAAMNVVSRELIGFIPNVSMDAAADQVTLDQPVRSPVVPAMAASDIAPSNVSATGPDQSIGYIDVNITKQRKVSFHLTAEEEKGLMAGGSKTPITQQRFEQAFRTLSNEVETDVAGQYIHASRAYGTIGTAPFRTSDDLSDATEVMRILDDNGAPKTGRALVLNTRDCAALLGKQGNVFKVNESGDEAARRFGVLQPLFGFMFGVSGQLATHDASNTLAGVMVNLSAGEAVGQTAITVDGGGSGEVLNAGDLVTFAGDNNKYVTDAMAASATTLNLRAPGLREAADNDTAITALGDYTPSVAFSRDAIQLVARVPAVPEGGDAAQDRIYVQDPHSMLVFEIAIYRQYRQVSYEVGLCWGVKTIKSEHMALLIG